LLLYLGFLKKVILDDLRKKLGDNLLESLHIGYLISIEKLVLDTCIETKDNLRELAMGCGLLKKSDDDKKFRIMTQGEGTLQRLQNEFDVDLPLKSYFVQAQLHENYVQLTLNQVVKIALLEEEEETSAIILKDKIVAIKDIFDSLCRNIWEQLDSSLIDCCEEHQREGLELKCILVLQNYKYFAVLLKQHLSNNVNKIVFQQRM
jgi:hypothetical protein